MAKEDKKPICEKIASLSEQIEDPAVVLKRNFTSPHLSFSWKMTSWCNFHCSYCINRERERTATEDLEEQANKIHKILEYERNVRGIKDVSLSLIGGEIGFFDLPSLLDIVGADMIERIYVNTNLSAPMKKWLALSNWCKFNGKHLKVMASCHLEEVDLETYRENIVTLGKSAVAKFVVNEENLEKTEETIRSLPESTQIAVTVERDLQQKVKMSGKLRKFKDKWETKTSAYTHTFCILPEKGRNFSLAGTNTEALALCRHGENTGLYAKGAWCTAGIDTLRLENGKLYRCGCVSAKRAGEIKTLDDIPSEPFICDNDNYCSLCYSNSVYRDAEKYNSFREYIESSRPFFDILKRAMNNSSKFYADTETDSSQSVEATASLSLISKNGTVTATSAGALSPLVFVYRNGSFAAIATDMTKLIMDVESSGRPLTPIYSDDNLAFIKNFFTLEAGGIHKTGRKSLHEIPKFYEEITPVWNFDSIIIDKDKTEITKKTSRLFTKPEKLSDSNIEAWIRKWEAKLSQADYIPDLTAGTDSRTLTYFWRNDSRIKKVFNRRTKRFCKVDFDGTICDEVLKRIRPDAQVIHDSADTDGKGSLSGNGTEWFKCNVFLRSEDFVRCCVPFCNNGILLDTKKFLPFLDPLLLEICPDSIESLRDRLLKRCAEDLADIPFWTLDSDTETYTIELKKDGEEK